MNNLLTRCLLSAFKFSDVYDLGNRQLEGDEDVGDTRKDEGRQQRSNPLHRDAIFLGQGWQQL